MQLWSGVDSAAKKYKKIHLTWSKHWLWLPQVSNVSMTLLNVQCPWHYWKLSAHGTCNVQCPWHYHLLHCAVNSIPSSGFWCESSVLGFQPISGMIWEPPVWLWDSSSSSPSPWEWSGYWLLWHSVPHCWMGRVLLLSFGVWWNDALPAVSLPATLHVSYIYYSSFLKCYQFLYGFSCWPLASWLVLADGDVDVNVAVPSGEGG